MFTQIIYFTNKNYLLPLVQSGFMTGYGCETALLKAANDILLLDSFLQDCKLSMKLDTSISLPMYLSQDVPQGPTPSPLVFSP